MKDLGKSVIRLQNGGGKIFSLLMLIVFVILSIIMFFSPIEKDGNGWARYIGFSIVLGCAALYGIFKSKTEIDLREKGIYLKTIDDKFYMLFEEIDHFGERLRWYSIDEGRTRNYYKLLVIARKDGIKLTCPIQITEEFYNKMMEISNVPYVECEDHLGE